MRHRDGFSKFALEVYYFLRINLGKTQLQNMFECARPLPGITQPAEIFVGQRSVTPILLGNWCIG